MRRILHASSEVYPLIKTGGLADVAASLPAALNAIGVDARVVTPAYEDALTAARRPERVGEVSTPLGEAGILQTSLPEGTVVWLVEHAGLFERPGNPYLDTDGQPWRDNAERFALFAHVVAALARGEAGLDWRADIVHAHDWQAGLVPALLGAQTERPASVFTVHNLSYQGLFDYETFARLGLSAGLWSVDGVEFYDQMSFLKAGLVFAERITTVSPTYAQEIQTPESGMGMDGLLRYRQAALTGIVNGIDQETWNPQSDRHLVKPYGSESLEDKQLNKLALRRAFKLPPRAEVPVIGMIGRLVHQKGIDLVLGALERLLKLPVQLALLGTGESDYEQALREHSQREPARLRVRIGYDETLAHRIEAGADLFLMPSRFEPCGLNQLYSMRYGTIPIVRRSGGLADTVVDATPAHLADGTATGVVFDAADSEALLEAIQRSLELYRQPATWRQMQQTGMRQDFSWHQSAARYLEVYAQAEQDRAASTAARG